MRWKKSTSRKFFHSPSCLYVQVLFIHVILSKFLLLVAQLEVHTSSTRPCYKVLEYHMQVNFIHVMPRIVLLLHAWLLVQITLIIVLLGTWLFLSLLLTALHNPTFMVSTILRVKAL